MIIYLDSPKKTSPIKTKLLSDLLFCDNSMKILPKLLQGKSKNVIIYKMEGVPNFKIC